MGAKENIELVRETTSRFERGELSEVESLWHPDAYLTGPEGWPEPGPFRGREAVMGQFQRLASDWRENRFPELEVIADNDEWVVVRLLWETVGAASSIRSELTLFGAYRVSEGTIAEGHFRWSAEDALEAAGLSSEGA